MKELEGFVKRYLVAGDEELPVSGLELESDASGDNAHGESTALVQSCVETGENGASPKSLKSMVQSVPRWEKAEKNAIAAALEKTGWNRKAASRLLGVSYRTILYKIEQFEMSAPASYLSSLSGARSSISSQAKGNGKAG